MSSNPPPTSYSDKVGYRDSVDDDIEALASKALSPISDFPPDDDDNYDDDNSITSSDDDDDDDDDMSLSDEEGQRDAMALRQKTSDIMNQYEDFVQDVNDASSPTKEIMNTLSGNVRSRGEDTVKSRITTAAACGGGGGDGSLNRDWSYDDRNLHDVGFGSADDSIERGIGGGADGSNKYAKRGLFKYAVPFFHSKRFKVAAVGVAVVFALVLIVGSMSNTGDRLGEGLGGVVKVEGLDHDDDVVTWFYEQTECTDHPSAQVHGDGHGCTWIHTTGRVNLRHARCGHDTTFKKRNGEFLMVKEICKKSCDECGGTESSAAVAKAPEAPKPDASAAIATVPEIPKPEPPTTISIDASKCEDHPTALIDTGGKHTCENYISHVGRVPLHNARCSHESPVKNEKGETLLVREVCRLSCGECGNVWEEPVAPLPGAQQQEAGMPQAPEAPKPDASAAIAAVPEIPKPEPPTTISIDASKCEDHPTALIDTGGKHTCENYISHVGRVPLHNARCSHESPVKNEKGETLLVREVCRLSCGECGNVWEEPVAPLPGAQQQEAGMPQAQTEGLEPAVQQSTAQEPQEGITNSGEITNWMTPVTLNNDSSSPSVDCKDDLTKVVAIGGKTCETYFSESSLEHLTELRCSHLTSIEDESGNILFVKDVCKMSCGLCGVESNEGMISPATTGQVMEAPSTGAVEEVSAPLDISPKYPTTLETEQAQSNAIPAFTTVEATPLEPASSPASATAETTPLESASSPVSTTTEATPLESVSSPSLQNTQDSISTVTTASMFTREEGWTGFSPSAAIDFCSEKGLSLCSFEAVCPQGEGNPPVVPSVHITWVPISDGSDWVQIGTPNPCQQWSKTNEGSPPWSNAGEAIEEITRRLYCCESEIPAQDAEKPTEVIASNTIEDSGNIASIQSIPSSTSSLSEQQSSSSEQQAHNYVANQYAPKWFDRASGWQGKTFEAAVQFCLSLEQNMSLCPYEAYCPMGPSSRAPYGGLRKEPTGSWAPAINNRKWWVQVGGNSVNVCEHEDIDESWGQDGSNEVLTRHIMCCKNGN